MIKFNRASYNPVLNNIDHDTSLILFSKDPDETPHVKTGNLKGSVRWRITILLGFVTLISHEQFL